MNNKSLPPYSSGLSTRISNYLKLMLQHNISHQTGTSTVLPYKNAAVYYTGSYFIAITAKNPKLISCRPKIQTQQQEKMSGGGDP